MLSAGHDLRQAKLARGGELMLVRRGEAGTMSKARRELRQDPAGTDNT